MKNFLKRNINKLIDLIFTPFVFVGSFVKNADNIFVKISKILLILCLFLLIIFVFVSKPYNKVLSGFYLQKYKTTKDAEKELLRIHPLQKNRLQDYKKILAKNNIYCFEETQKTAKINKCIGYENNILKRYRWEVILTPAGNDKAKIARISMKKVEVDNSFKVNYFFLKNRLNSVFKK